METREQNSVWLTADEAAQYLKVERRTLLLWTRQGKIKGHPLSGTKRHIWRYLHAELNEFSAKLNMPSVALPKGGWNEESTE